MNTDVKEPTPQKAIEKMNELLQSRVGVALTPQKVDKRSTSAPIWLTQRMDASLKRRTNTLEEIQMQYKASMEVRRRSIDNRDS
jgi:hypothetical protein